MVNDRGCSIKLPHRLNIPLQATSSGSQFCIQPRLFPGKPCKISNIRRLVQMNGSIAFLTVKRDVDLFIKANLNAVGFGVIYSKDYLNHKKLLYLFAGILTHLVAFRLETNLRKKGIDALSQSNFAYFDTHTSGNIRKTIDDNAAETHTIIAHLIPDNTTSVMTLLLLVLATFAVNLYLGIAFVILAKAPSANAFKPSSPPL